MKTIGTRIKEARGLIKMKQMALSAKTGKAISTIRNWEGDKVKISEGDVMLLAQHLGVRFDWLLKGEGEMLAPNQEKEKKPAQQIPMSNWKDMAFNEVDEGYAAVRKDGVVQYYMKYRFQKLRREDVEGEGND